MVVLFLAFLFSMMVGVFLANNNYMAIMILFASLVVIIVVIVFAYYKHKSNIEKVKRNSNLIKQLFELNNKYQFNNDIKVKYELTKRYDKKRDFDKTSLVDYFIGVIEEERGAFEDINEKILDNRKKYPPYLSDYGELKPSNTDKEIKALKISQKGFSNIENKLYADNKEKPALDCVFYCVMKYSSPQARNRYSKNYTFTLVEMNRLRLEVQRNIAVKKTVDEQIRIERAKMSDSLRYDVLKRDGFRCCICGATADSGVKLHVDHIYPVSKGGRTEMKNLQTLCERCNMGKRDKV